MDQVIFIVVNSFAHDKNDILGSVDRITNVSFIFVGSHEKSEKSSFHRIYDDGAKVTCPKHT